MPQKLIITNVGSDELEPGPRDLPTGATHVWVSYESNGYDGSGLMIARAKRRFFVSYIGHCSCYDALDGMTKWEGIGTKRDLAKFFRYDNNVPGRLRDPKDSDFDLLKALAEAFDVKIGV